ncbi:hypothetical protein [Bacteroides graminisolvens]|uniref:hypothetical protein n=1 Tax=Bacteroides graminisolvens TaxID=477666 RepID=UPI000A8BEA05|nr:hypothetical protein [Bacteroides graminisolvens]
MIIIGNILKKGIKHSGKIEPELQLLVELMNAAPKGKYLMIYFKERTEWQS